MRSNQSSCSRGVWTQPCLTPATLSCYSGTCRARFSSTVRWFVRALVCACVSALVMWVRWFVRALVCARVRVCVCVRVCRCVGVCVLR